MKKKFECKTCKKQFEADDSGYVVCPHCHSDNVELYSHNVSARTWKIAGAIVVILLVCGAYFLATTRTKGSSTLDNPHPVEPDTISDPPTVNVGMPVLNDDGMYSVEVKGNNISQGTKYYYVMMSHFGKQVLQKNNDGHFSNIPFCPDDGNSYDFAIMDGKADTLLCIPVEQTGFIKQAIIDEEDRMTTGQLQTLIDTQDSSLNGIGESDYLAPDYKLILIGIPSDMTKPESWTDVFQMIEFGILENVTVVKLEYDDKNRVNSVTLKVSVQN